MENYKSFSTLITAVVYSFTIVLYTKADIIKQYNLSDIALNKIAQISHKTGNLILQNTLGSNF